MYTKLPVVALIALFALSCKSLVTGALVPNAPFSESTIPPEPDYSNPDHWAALPDREDEADRVPEGESDGQKTANVDVFFLHPTTYYKDDFWNQPLDDEKTNGITDESVMRNQASAFNAAAKIYAPRYRQAALGGYIANDWVSMESALNLAYEDIKVAFTHYLENWADDRPIILASHSQGSGHMVRLVHDFFSGEENADRRARLIAVYAIGGEIPKDEVERTFPDVPICGSPNELGCIVVYNSVREGTTPEKEFERRMWYPGGWELIEDEPLICVNPVTWKTDFESSALPDHIGAVRFGDNDLTPKPDPDWLTASCREDGRLNVELVGSRTYGIGTRGDNLHVADYSLFYMDIRRNAVARIDNFFTSPAQD